MVKYLDVMSCIEEVELAFRAHGRREVPPPVVAGVHTERGRFHLKAGLFGTTPRRFAAKLNANFMDNRPLGLPTIQGLVLLCDAENGRLLAAMDTIAITALRTGAATAVAARYLARDDARVVALCGCGTQGRAQLRALSRVRRLERALVHDTDEKAARGLAEELGAELALDIEVVPEFEAAVRAADVCVTCTPARAPVLCADWVRPGTFLAGVGADAEEKHELPPELLRKSRVVTDVTSQCAVMGDLHHALANGTLKLNQVHAELGEIVAGLKPGRTGPDEITVFDSTGMAIQDVAAAALVYRAAMEAGGSARFDFISWEEACSGLPVSDPR